MKSGLPGFEAVTWFGFTVPAGTPKEVVDKLNSEIGKVLAMPDVKKNLAQQGIDVGGGTPAQFGAYMKDEFAEMGRAGEGNRHDDGLTMAAIDIAPSCSRRMPSACACASPEIAFCNLIGSTLDELGPGTCTASVANQPELLQYSACSTAG